MRGLDGGVVAVRGSVRAQRWPALAYDGTALLVAWEEPPELWVRRFSRDLVPLEDAKAVAAGLEPSVASPAPNVFILGYGARASDGGVFPRARCITYAPRDAGEPDAGAPDAGVEDAGLVDAGVLDGGPGPVRQYEVGCSCAGASAPPLLLCLLALLRRKRSCSPAATRAHARRS